MRSNYQMGLCRFHPEDSGIVFAACGPTLYRYDLRASDDIMISSASASFECSDDINDFDIDLTSGNLCVPSDDGGVSILSKDLSLLATTGEHNNHENVCGVTRWIPNSDCFVSAGHDQRLMQWSYDSVKGKVRRLKQIQIDSLYPDDSFGMSVANPRFVTAVDVLSNGRDARMAVGIGDGSVLELDVIEGLVAFRKPRSLMKDLHASSVSSISYASEFGFNRSRIWTAGNDGNLTLCSTYNSSDPLVRLPLPSKPNVVKSVQPGTVAVSSVDNNIYIYTL